jgi:anaerobic selenocysteine-containing dehydrogenase
MSESTHYRTCPLCEATCGLEITIKDGAIARIRGDRDDVFSKGFICPKGSTLKQLHADPERVRTPLIKRDGVFVEATWDEAFAAVAEGLGRIWADGNRDAVGLYLGNPNAHSIASSLFGGPVIRGFRTKNLYSASTVDQMPKHVSSGYMFGSTGAIPVPDLDRTDYLLMLGANPHESNGSLCTAPDFPGRMEAIRERGGRIVTVDPRFTKTAAASDEHVAIRPGTDALWMAALVTEIKAAGLIDTGSVGTFLTGLDDMLAALAPFTAESVAAHTRVPAETTRRTARELATAPTAAVYARIGAHTTQFGTLASWLTDVLNIVTGNLDRPGGAMFPGAATGAKTSSRTPGGRGFSIGRWASRVSGYPEVNSEFPTAALAEEIETPGDGQIRALVCVAGNPVRSIQNSARLDAALETLEFMVSVDIYVNETSRHADVLLPAPSPLAKPQYDMAFYALSVRNVANYSPPMHPADDPTEPGMPEYAILAKLALISMGMDPSTDPAIVGATILGDVAKRSHLGDVEAIIDLMLQTGPYEAMSIETLEANPHGVDLGPLQPRLPGLLRTASGTIEMFPELFANDVLRLAAVLDAAPDEGLLLVGRRHLRSNNSWMHNLEVLVKGKPRCTLQIHPADAAAAGLVDGGQAAVSNETGSVSALVEIDDAIAVGTVSLPHGWGHDAPGARWTVAKAAGGVNSNELTGESVIDPLSGNGRLNAIPVSVAAV